MNPQNSDFIICDYTPNSNELFDHPNLKKAVLY